MGAPEILHPDLTGAPSPFDAQIARMRAAADIEAPTTSPVAAGGEGPSSSAAGGGLILNAGTFATTFDPPPRDYSRNPFHGIEVHQAGIWQFPRPAEAESCGAPYRGVKGCGCGVKVVRDHCDNLACSHPYCEQTNRDRRGRDVFDRIQLARRGRPVIYTIFTVPPAQREAAAIEKNWRRWLRNLLAFLKKDYDLEYAAERSDPCGEDGERWHPHVNLLWVRKSGKGWIEDAELDAIKARWKKIIGVRPEDPIDVRTAYSRKERKIAFWCRYLGRPWSRWAKGQKYLLRVKWFGRPPKVEKEPAGPCPRCGRDVICLKLGSQQAAEDLAALGYERLLEEYEDRKAHFRRMRPAKFKKFQASVSAQGTIWTLEGENHDR